MIERLQFNEVRRDTHPFTSSTPLKITFHTQSLKNLTEEDAIAFELLQELSRLPEIEALQTEPGIFSNVEVRLLSRNEKDFPLKVIHRNGEVISHDLHFPYNLDNLVERFVKLDGRYPDRESLIQDVLVAQAHYSLEQHILVTTSSNLLEHRDDIFVRRSNPYTPSQAAKVVGLFLRSKGVFSIPRGKITCDISRERFYKILTRHYLPDMHSYFGACVDASDIRKDDILALGQSIYTRCSRALQARDAIGTHYYSLQNNDIRDAMMYHFDYLTLVLSGAFDAQMRVAYRAYQITKPKENYASPRNEQFMEALGKHSDAAKLHTILSGTAYKSVETLLVGLRNTIHGAGLTPIGVEGAYQSRDGQSFVEIPTNDVNKIWNAAQQLNTLEYWGLVKDYGSAMLEPYTYATALIHECFKLINQIAAATDVSGLFTNGIVPPTRTKPSNEGGLDGWISDQIIVLG